MKKWLSLILLVNVFCLLPGLRLWAEAPGVINYQGRVAVEGTNFDGEGQFKFALVDAAGTLTYWSHDGSSANGGEPASAVSLTVIKGLFSVELGDAQLDNMTEPLSPAVFDNQELYLRTWFSDGVNPFEQLAPDRRVASVGYALAAENANTLETRTAADFLEKVTYDTDDDGVVDTASLPSEALEQMVQDFVVADGQSVSAGSAVSLFEGRVFPGMASPPFNGLELFFNDGAVNGVAMLNLSDARVLIAYGDQGNANRGTAVIGEVSGPGVSFGPEFVFNDAGTTNVALEKLSGTEVAIAFSDQGNGNSGTVLIATVSGNNELTFSASDAFNNGPTVDFSMDGLSDTRLVFVYRDDGNFNHGRARIVDLAGGGIDSLGPETSFNAATTNDVSVARLTDNSFALAYKDNLNASRGTLMIGTVSGDTPSFGDAVIFNDQGTSDILLVEWSATQFLIIYSDNGNGFKGTAQVATLSGENLAFGAETVFSPAGIDDLSLVRLSGSDFLVVYADQSNASYGTMLTGAVAGDEVSFAEGIIFHEAATTAPQVAFISGVQHLFAYVDGGNGDQGTARVRVASGFNPLGVASEAASSGESIAVVLQGISGNHAGLVTEGFYYGQLDGSVTQALSGIPVGRALSSTGLMVRNLFNDLLGNAIVADVDNQVGIGTADPEASLHVAGDARITGNIVDGLGNAGRAGQVLSSSGSATSWVDLPPSVSIHSQLVGLDADDHEQYAILPGRLGGQVFIGGILAEEGLTFRSTVNELKGDILLADDGGQVGIGLPDPEATLHVGGDVRVNGEVSLAEDGGNVGIGTSSPAAILHVIGDSRLTGNVLLAEGGGTVGIGTTEPLTTLHIEGDALISGALFDSAGNAGLSGQVLFTTGTTTSWSDLPVVIVDHGNLTGQGDDDHPQYALLPGRAGGQVFTGGTQAGDDLILRSTSNGAKGDILLADEGGNVGVGTSVPLAALHVEGTAHVTGAFFDSTQSGGASGQLLSSTQSGTAWIDPLLAEDFLDKASYDSDGDGRVDGTSLPVEVFEQFASAFPVAQGESVGVGDVVSVLDGEIFKGVHTETIYGSEINFRTADTGAIVAARLSDNQFLIAFPDDSNAGQGTILVATVSGLGLSFGAEAIFNADQTSNIAIAPLTANQFAVFFVDEGDASLGKAVLGSLSGTDISFAPEIVFNNDATDFVSVAALTEDQLVLAFRDVGGTDHGTVLLGTVTGPDLNFSSETVFNNAGTNSISVARLSDTRFAISYYDFASFMGAAVVGTLSGADFSFGTEAVFNESTTFTTSIASLSGSKVVVAYRDGGNLLFGTAVVGDISGSDISFGAETVFILSHAADPSVLALSEDRVLFTFHDFLNANLGMLVPATVSGLELALESIFEFNSACTGGTALARLSDSRFAIVYLDCESGSQGMAQLGIYANLRAVGIAQTPGAAGVSVPVVVEGIYTGLSGLEGEQFYYGQSDGTLSTAPGPFLIGRALSPDTFLVFNQFNNPLQGSVAFDAGGGNLILVPNGGNVGVGETAPIHPLQMASGAHVTAGGTWTNASDRNLKENLRPVEPQAILDKLASLPIQTWNYKREISAVRHIGPTAQDFQAAFGLGGSDKSIGTVDADGVAMAAIQALCEQLRQLKQENQSLHTEMERLKEAWLQASGSHSGQREGGD